MIPKWEKMLEFWLNHLNRDWKRSEVFYNGMKIYKTLDLQFLPIDQVNQIREKFDMPGSWDEKVLAIAQKVRACYKWTDDLTAHGKTEYWDKYSNMAPMLLKDAKIKDDCDGIAVGIAGTLILCGIPYYRVNIAAGPVYPFGPKNNHAYVLYLPEMFVNKQAIIETSYNVRQADIKFMHEYMGENPAYMKPWWKLTQGHSYSKRTFKLSGQNFLKEAKKVIEG